jgi:hypothetical protein
MKTTVKFKALKATKIRNEKGLKQNVGKDKTFITTEKYAELYRKHKRLFEEVEIIVSTKPKVSKVKASNSDAFPVTISDTMTNRQVEAILEEMGAKYTKKSSRAKLLEAYETRLKEIEEEKLSKDLEVVKKDFEVMIDGLTIEALQDHIKDEEFLNKLSKDGLDIEEAKTFMEEVLEKKLAENEESKKGNED